MIKSLLQLFGLEKQRKELEPGHFKERRHSGRIDLGVDTPVTVHLLFPGSEESGKTLTAKVRSISLQGASLIFEPIDMPKALPLGKIFVSSLSVEGFVIPLQLETVRLTANGDVAVRFRPPFPKELSKLEKFLEPRFLGDSLMEIISAKREVEESKVFRWFQGMNDTHLFSWELKNGKPAQQQLVFLNRVVEWKDGSVRSGRVKQDLPVESVRGWVGSEVLEFNDGNDRENISMARALVSFSKIEAKLKDAFLENVK